MTENTWTTLSVTKRTRDRIKQRIEAILETQQVRGSLTPDQYINHLLDKDEPTGTTDRSK